MTLVSQGCSPRAKPPYWYRARVAGIAATVIQKPVYGYMMSDRANADEQWALFQRVETYAEVLILLDWVVVLGAVCGIVRSGSRVLCVATCRLTEERFH